MRRGRRKQLCECEHARMVDVLEIVLSAPHALLRTLISDFNGDVHLATRSAFYR